MITRSIVIKKAQNKFLHGATDPMWTNEHWNDYFHTAVDWMHADIVDADMGFFTVRNTTVSRDPVTGRYPLPSDLYSLRWVKDSVGPIYQRSMLEIEEDEKAGFVITNDEIELMNWTSSPTTLTISYIRRPTDFGDWDGTDDTQDSAHQLDTPLNTPQAARVLSELVYMQAASKDGVLTADRMAVIERMVANFTDRLGSRVNSGPEVLGLE